MDESKTGQGQEEDAIAKFERLQKEYYALLEKEQENVLAADSFEKAEGMVDRAREKLARLEKEAKDLLESEEMKNCLRERLIESWDHFLFLGKPKGEKKKSEEGQKMLEELIPKICEETKLKPTQPEVIAYDSGMYMLRDAIVHITDKYSMFDNYYKKATERTNKKGKGLLRIIAEMPYWVIRDIYYHSRLAYLSKQILGINDIPSMSFSQYNLRLSQSSEPYDDIGIAAGNIRRCAERNSLNPDYLTQYVICHEYIHTLQSANTIKSTLKKKIMKDSEEEDKKNRRKSVELIMIPVEGHAEFFTNLVYKKNYKFSLPRRSPSLYRKLKLAFYGMTDQMKRYTMGGKYISYLYEHGGIELAHMPLSQPPESIEEIIEPEKYLKRIKKI